MHFQVIRIAPRGGEFNITEDMKSELRSYAEANIFQHHAVVYPSASDTGWTFSGHRMYMDALDTRNELRDMNTDATIVNLITV